MTKTPDDLLVDALTKETILNTAIDVQSALQLLISKGIITTDELNQMRAKVRTLPKYRDSLKYVEDEKSEAVLCKTDPEAYLRKIMEEKLRGK